MSLINPTWVTVSGEEENKTLDVYGKIPWPGIPDLLAMNVDTIFACTDWISRHVAATPLRLYHNEGGKSGSFLQPHDHTEDIKEIRKHPAKRILDRPNPSMMRYDLLKFIDSNLSLAGESFIKIETATEDKIPIRLWPLITKKVEPIYKNGQLIRFDYHNRAEPDKIPVDAMLWFKLHHYDDPYKSGYSPVRAIYERYLIERYENAYLLSLFKNQARPDSLIGMKGVTADQLEKVQKQMDQRMAQGGIGGPLAVDVEDMDFKALNWQPKDVFTVDLYKYIRLCVFNVFGLHPALFDAESSNRATSYEARHSSQLNTILPRCRIIEQKLLTLAERFDDKIIYLFDNPVEENTDLLHQQRLDLLDRKVITINELRKDLGMEDVEWGQAPIEKSQPDRFSERKEKAPLE